MNAEIRSITIDCSEPTRLAQFWAAVTGYQLGQPDELDEVAVLRPRSGQGPRLLFLKVPERKSVKNRVHVDIKPDLPIEQAVEQLLALGATRVRVVSESDDDVFTVMQDPEGNEFCVESR
ncbi:MAG TPA: VOC family protein [Chloroflexota bacterium]|nr:VOC family protein [Chloroflexota bacterium]